MRVYDTELTNFIEYMPLDVISPDGGGYPIRENNLNFIVCYKSKVYTDLLGSEELLEDLLF